MANKVKYGLSKCYYAVATIADAGTATYGTPKALPGAVSISLDPDSNLEEFKADNITYFASGEDSGYSGSLELALIPDDFRKDVLGEVLDGQSVLFEDADAQTVHFALLFQFEGDENAAKHVLYNCYVTGRPSIASQTKEDTVTPVTETIELAARAIKNTTLNKNVIKSRNTNTSSTSWTTWTSTVYTGTAAG